MTELLLRSAGARVFERGTSLFLMDPRGAVRRLDGDSASLTKAVLSLLETERSREALLDALAELVGGPVEPVSVVDELLALLRQSGAVQLVRRDARLAPGVASRGSRGLRVVLCVTGAIQSVHTPWLVALLLGEGHDVRVAMTDNALRFCRAEGIEALTHNPVRASLWSADASGPAPHIQLAEWADLVVVAPASASTLARLAAGSCEDIVSATAIATRAPVVLAPSMNVAMADSASVRRNVETLVEDGFIVVHPTTGHEVAHAPSERVAMRGTMPNPPEFVAMLRAIIGTAPSRRASAASSVTSWDQRYREPIETRPWDGDALDDGLRACVERVCAGRSSLRALDVGCGSGLLSVELARLGCVVTAVDVAESALAIARAREGGDRVHWLCADAMSATLAGRFDLVCDRALLHVLPQSAQRAYAQRLARWLVDGGALVLTAHSEEAPSELGTTRFTVRMVAELFDGLLEIESVERCSMRGPAGQSVSARRYVLRA